jgi:hypothetical protein
MAAGPDHALLGGPARANRSRIQSQQSVENPGGWTQVALGQPVFTQAETPGRGGLDDQQVRWHAQLYRIGPDTLQDSRGQVLQPGQRARAHVVDFGHDVSLTAQILACPCICP